MQSFFRKYKLWGLSADSSDFPNVRRAAARSAIVRLKRLLADERAIAQHDYLYLEFTCRLFVDYSARLFVDYSTVYSGGGDLALF